MKKVSVIVPIYNVETKISKCIESLLKQELCDIQIILVNDGSTDSSGKIAKKYAMENPHKIIYVEKKNGGLSDARNCGIKYATGEYLSFVDSDDYVNQNLYRDLETYMNEQYDMVKFKIAIVDEEGNIISKNNSPVFADKTGEEAFNILYKTDTMTEVAWGYIYRTKFYRENKFEFSKGRYHEDFGLMPLVLMKAMKVASTDVLGYNYVQTQNSITRENNNIKYQRANDLLYFYDKMIKKIENYNLSRKSIENIIIYYTNCIILQTENLSGKERKEFIKQIKSRKLAKNIKVRDFKQFMKRIVLDFSIELYLKIR